MEGAASKDTFREEEAGFDAQEPKNKDLKGIVEEENREVAFYKKHLAKTLSSRWTTRRLTAAKRMRQSRYADNMHWRFPPGSTHNTLDTFVDLQDTPMVQARGPAKGFTQAEEKEEKEEDEDEEDQRVVFTDADQDMLGDDYFV